MKNSFFVSYVIILTKNNDMGQNWTIRHRGVYFYLFRDIHPGTVYEFLRISEKFWMSHSMPKTFPEVMNIMLKVNCITKTFPEFQTLTESVYSIHS